MHLDVRAFALATGIVWGAWVLLSTWWVILFDGQQQDPVWLSHLYRGYSLTWAGGIVGFIWGFAGGFIGGGALGWFYNRLVGAPGPDPDADPDEHYH